MGRRRWRTYRGCEVECLRFCDHANDVSPCANGTTSSASPWMSSNRALTVRFFLGVEPTHKERPHQWNKHCSHIGQ